MSFAQPFQDYEILDRVGAGAMGTVFKARHKKLGRIVALKVLRPSLARDTRYVDRLRREARIVAALNHANIVTGYDLGEESGYHFFVMEFVEGKSLRALLGEWGIFAEDQVLRVAMQVAAALDHAVERGVIHRDIKPGNILIDEAGNVKLTDMGLAKGPADLALTRDGATVGTPQYISPEQARNPQDVDVRSDLYSLGATLYHMATGQPPFRGESMAEVITKVLHETPLPPRTLNPALGEGLSLVIRKLLAKNLRLRYQTPRELIADLERVRNAELPAVDERRLLAAETGPQPNAWLWSLAALAGAALLGLAVLAGMHLRGERAAPPATDAALAALDEELAALPSIAQRLSRLAVAGVDADRATAAGIAARRSKVVADLQREVDRAAARLQGEAWPATLAWIADPTRWPTVTDFERERVSKELLARTGLLREQLPASINGASLDAVLAAVEQAMRRRDQGLQEDFGRHLEVVLPARAEELSSAGDFAAAERLWRDGYDAFFDGLRHPRPELLPAAQRSEARQRYERLEQDALAALRACEAKMADALTLQAQQFAQSVAERLEAGSEPQLLRAELDTVREALTHAYPAHGRFRAPADPWPAIDGLLGGLERQLELRQHDNQQRDVEQLLDLAWRAFAAGDAAAALGVLGDPAADPAAQRERLAAHRATLHACELVTQAVLRALQRTRLPLPGYPRAGGAAVELRVPADDGPLRLLAQPPGGSPRAAHLSEFRFDDLWSRATAAAPDLFDAISGPDRERGRAVLAMVGDELQARTDPFLRDEVWPRIVRGRGGKPGTEVDRALAFGRLREAWARARASGEVRELVSALAEWNAVFAQGAAPLEQKTAATAGAWLAHEQLRQTRLRDLRAATPSGAAVEVSTDGTTLQGQVVLDARTLQRDAAEGWQLQGDRLQLGGGAVPWSEVARRRLEVEVGLPASAFQCRATVELVLPSAEQGTRAYLFDFRGIGIALVVTADDRAHAALVREGRREPGAVQAAAIRRALAGVLNGRAGAPVVPGAVHRLTIALDASPARTHGQVRVSLDQADLCEESLDLQPEQLPILSVYPLQDLAVRRVELLAVGL